MGRPPRPQPESSHLLYSHPKVADVSLDDPGPGFKMEDLKHAAVSNPADDPMAHMDHPRAKGSPPWGLGLMLTQQLVDELVYNEARNEVVLIKYL